MFALQAKLSGNNTTEHLEFTEKNIFIITLREFQRIMIIDKRPLSQENILFKNPQWNIEEIYGLKKSY